LALDLTAAGVLLLPLVPLVLAVGGRRGNFLLTAAPVGIEDLVTSHRQAVYLLLPAVAAAIVAFLQRPPAERNRKLTPATPFLFLLIVFYATVAPLWVAHRFGGLPLFRPRYTSIPYLLPFAAAGWLAVAWPRRSAGVAFALVAVVLGQATEGAARRIAANTESPRLTHEDWREATAWVNARGAGRASPVFVRAGFIETDGYLGSSEPLARVYLTLPFRTLYPLAPAERAIETLTFAGEFADESGPELIRRAGEAWFVVKGDSAFADKTAANAAERLARNGVAVEVADRKTWRNVTAFRLRCRPPTGPHK
jgi:hypothetical protein